MLPSRIATLALAKALNTSGVTAGGALIPQAVANEIIELLRSTTVIRAIPSPQTK